MGKNYTRIGTPLVLIAITLMLLACGGGSSFVPHLGPFSGVLMTDTATVGSISLTAADRQVGGTGYITHNELLVAVSFAGVIDDHRISGTMVNALLGSGTFNGEFTDMDSCRGYFEYTDTLGFATTTGTWVADID